MDNRGSDLNQGRDPLLPARGELAELSRSNLKDHQGPRYFANNLRHQ